MIKRISLLFFLILALMIKAEAQSTLEPGPEERVFSNPSIAPFVPVWDKIPQEIRKKNSFKRLEWFYRSRIDEKGAFPKEHINRQKTAEIQKVQEKMNSGNLSPIESADWTNIGPSGIDMSSSFIPYWGNVSGRVRGIDVHPTNPDVVYIGVAAGGIWKTTNGGQNWVDKSGDLNLLTFGAIAIDPSNPDIIYAGSGEAIWLFNTTTFEGDGLYKSTNGGDNWTRITNGFGSQTQFSNIEVSPTNSNIVLASLGTGNFNNPGVTNQGVWRSSDAGITWTRVINLTGAFDVAFHPTDGNFAYAVIGNRETANGFYISTDAGVTWVNSSSGLPEIDLYMGRLQFDIAPSNPSTIYTVVHNYDVPISGNMRTCAYKSTNGGANWAQISFGINIAGTYDGSTVADQGSYDLCIAVNPTNPDNVFLGNVELSKTNDGSKFSFIRNPAGYNSGVSAWDSYTHVDIHNVMFAPSNPNILYVCCDGGIYKSTNGGTDFFHINNGINTIQFYRVASHPTNPSILYGGAQDNGNFSTTDKGATTWKFETSGDGMECFVDYSNANNVFMSTQNGSLNKSTDAGVTWTNVVGSSSATAWTTPFWQHPTVSTAIYAGYNRGIIRSLNRGNTWSYLVSSLVASPNTITSVAHSPVNPLYMLAAASYNTTSPVLLKSTNEGIGSSWSNITANLTGSGFTGASIHRIVADPSDENTYYITRASYSTGQVLKTTNFGTNWTDVSGDLPSITVSDLFIDPLSTNHLYAGNDFGVYFSSNGGSNWTKLSTGMPFVPVLDFSYYNNGGTRYLRAATHGRGVYEINFNSPLPVTLSAFTHSVSGRDVKLNWSTSLETNNAGFEIERANSVGETPKYSKIGYVEGKGNTNTVTNYNYSDNNLSSGKYLYRLKQIDNNGNFEYHTLSGNVEIGTPKRFGLSQNYPNPFNPTTKIDFELPSNSRVKLSIYDVTGRMIKELVNETREAGYYTIEFNAAGLSGGIYFCKMESGSFSSVKKLMLIK